MDIIIPFVTCKDKVWMKNLISFTDFYRSNQNFNYLYYYDYGTLKYVLRGIDKYIPYVNNIFLVVSNIEQVPDYVDQSKVTVVLHKDFIPEEYLPTFQANTIEMFMYNIPGLGEEFMYFNDDIIPISSIKYEELFKDGLPCINFVENNIEKYLPTYEIFNTSFFEALNTARILSNKEIEYTGIGLNPVHGPVAYLKSICIEAASKKRHKNLLKFYTSTFRTHTNLNQFYWCDILYFLNKYVPSKIDTLYTTTQEIDNINLNNIPDNIKFICINDCGSLTHSHSVVKEIINKKLDFLLPEQCKYERYL